MIEDKKKPLLYPRIVTGQPPIGYAIIPSEEEQRKAFSTAMDLLKNFLVKQLYPSGPPPNHLYNAVTDYLDRADMFAKIFHCGSRGMSVTVLSKDKAKLNPTKFGPPQIIDTPILRERFYTFDPNIHEGHTGILLPVKNKVPFLPDTNGYIFFQHKKSVSQWREYNHSHKWVLICDRLEEALAEQASMEKDAAAKKSKSTIHTPEIKIEDEHSTAPSTIPDEKIRGVRKRKTTETKAQNPGLIYEPPALKKSDTKLIEIISKSQRLAINIGRRKAEQSRQENILARLTRIFKDKNQSLNQQIKRHEFLLARLNERKAKTNSLQNFQVAIGREEKTIEDKKQELEILVNSFNQKSYDVENQISLCKLSVEQLDKDQQQVNAVYAAYIEKNNMRYPGSNKSTYDIQNYWAVHYRCEAFKKAAQEIAVRLDRKKTERSKNQEKLKDWQNLMHRRRINGAYHPLKIKPGHRPPEKMDLMEFGRRERNLIQASVSVTNLSLREQVALELTGEAVQTLIELGARPNKEPIPSRIKRLKLAAKTYVQHRISVEFKTAKALLPPEVAPDNSRKAPVIMYGIIPDYTLSHSFSCDTRELGKPHTKEERTEQDSLNYKARQKMATFRRLRKPKGQIYN